MIEAQATLVWVVAIAASLAGGALAMLRPRLGLVVYLWLDFMRPLDALPALAAGRPMLVLAAGLLLAALRDPLGARQNGGGKGEWTGVAVLCCAVVPASLLLSGAAVASSLEPLKLAVVAWLLARFLDRRGDFDRALLVIAGSLTVLALDAIWQVASGGGGFVVVEGPGAAAGRGLFHDNNDLARALLFGVALWSAFAAPPQSRRWRLGALLALAVTVEGIAFSGSRGGFIALAVAGSYLLFAHLRPLPAALAALALLVVIVRVATPAPVARRIETIARPAAQSSVQSRLDIWREGVRRATARPLLGHGVGTFAVPHAKGPGHPPRSAHNIYVELFYETGVVGLAAYLYFLGSTWAALVRLRGGSYGPPAAPWLRSRAIALEAGLIGFAVASLFLSNAFQSIPFVAAGAAVALRRLGARS